MQQKDDEKINIKGKEEETVSDQTKKNSSFDVLPEEVITIILSNLNTKSLISTSLVCRKFLKLSKKELAKRENNIVFVVVPNFYQADAPFNQDLFQRLDASKNFPHAFFKTKDEATEHLSGMTMAHNAISGIFAIEFDWKKLSKNPQFILLDPKDIIIAHIHKPQPGRKAAWIDIHPDKAGKSSQDKLSEMIKLIESITIENHWKTDTKMLPVVIAGKKMQIPTDISLIYNIATSSELPPYKKVASILELSQKLANKPQTSSLFSMFKHQSANNKSEQDVAKELENIGNEKTQVSKAAP